MIRRKEAGLLVVFALTLLITTPFLHAVAQGILAEMKPRVIAASPGELVEMSLVVTNKMKSSISVTGLRVRVTSEEVFFLPVRLPFGEYKIPFDDPVGVDPGETEEIRKNIEVPNVPLFGRFRLHVTVETTGGTTETSFLVNLRYSTLAVAVFLLLILIILLIVYLIIRKIRRRLSRAGRYRRRLSRLDIALAERDRYLELKRRLEERRAEGRVGDDEYARLKKEYDSALQKIQSELESIRPELERDLERLKEELKSVEGEIKTIRARMEVGEINKSAARKLLRDKEKRVSELRSLISSIERRIERIKSV